MSSLVQYSGCHTPAADAFNNPGWRCMLPGSPTAGNVSFVAVATTNTGTPTLPTSVIDNQGNSYALLTSNTSGGVKIGLYAAMITLSGATAGVPNYPGGYLEPNAITGSGSSGQGFQVCAFEVTLTGAALSSIQAAIATATSGTSTTPSVGPIAFAGPSGGGLSIGVFGWYTGTGTGSGGITPGSGYTLLYGSDQQEYCFPGLAVVAKQGDTTGSATPSITLANSIQWYGCGAVATAPAALITATVNTPNGIPALDLGQTYTFTVTGINTAFAGSPFSATGGTLNSQTIHSPTSATLVITAGSSRGNIVITDTISGQTVGVAGTHPLIFQLAGDGGKWWAAQYYWVSPSGNDSNSGTQGSPWATLSGAVTNVGSVGQAHDVLLFTGGGSFTVGASVNPANYYFFTSTTTTPATFTTTVANIDMMLCGLTNGLWVSYLDFVNTLSAQDGNLVPNVGSRRTTNATYTDGAVIDHVSSTGGDVGIGCSAGGTATSANLYITNCAVSDCFGYGMTCNGTSTSSLSNVAVIGNTVTAVPGTATPTAAGGVGIRTADVSAGAGPTRLMLNTVTYCGSASQTSTNASLLAVSVNGVYIEGNAAVGYQYGGDSTCIDLDIGACNSSIRYNLGANTPAILFYSYSCFGNNQIAYNLGVNGGTAASTYGLVTLASNSGNSITVYANTVIGSGLGPGLLINSGSGPARAFDNLLVASAATPGIDFGRATTGGDYCDGNCTQSGPGTFLCAYNGTNYTSLASWQAELNSTLGIGGANEAGPFGSQFADGAPYVADWTAANIAAVAARFAPVAGSAAAAAPISLATLATKAGLAAYPPYDLAANPTAGAGAIGAVAVPSSSYATAYDAAVMGLSPFSRWRLGETAAAPGTNGLAYDAMGSQPPAAWTSGGRTLGAAAIVPRGGRASAAVDGSSGEATLVSAATATATALSVSAWIDPTSIASTAIVASGNRASAIGWSLQFAAGQLEFAVTDTGGSNVLAGTTSGLSVPLGVASHVVATWSQSTGQIAIYVNGVAQTVATSGTNPTSVYLGGAAIAGNPAGTTFGLAGSIEDLALFRAALSPSQASAIYAAGAAPVVGYTLAGPGSVIAGKAAALIVTPLGTVGSDAVTLSDGGHGSTLSPSAPTWSGGSSARQVLFSNPTPGTYHVAATSADGGTVYGSPLTITVTAAPSRRPTAGWVPPRRFRRF